MSEEFQWKILKGYFEKYGFVSHQTESFNHFINFGLPRIVIDEPPIVYEQYKDDKLQSLYVVQFTDLHVSFPATIEEDRTMKSIYPCEARQRDLTYDAPVFVNLTEVWKEGDQSPMITHHTRVIIGRIPIMLRSNRCHLSSLTKQQRIKAGECEFDNGGYFIVKGKERVLIPQVRIVYNIPIVYKNSEKYKCVAEMRSMSEETGHSVLVQAMIGMDERTLLFALPYTKDNTTILMGVVFCALGIKTEEEIDKLIGLDHPQVKRFIRIMVRDAYFCREGDEALKYIGQFASRPIEEKEKINYGRQIITCELFPHMGITSTNTEKAYMLGHLVRKLFCTHLNLREEDDKDNYVNKRVESAGILYFELFRQLFKKFIESVVSSFEKKKQKPDIISIISRNTIITNGFNHNFCSSNWGVPKNSYIRNGVAQILSRLSYGATLSNLRRLAIPIGKESKISKIRQIHSSQCMFICPCECFDPNTKILMWGGGMKLAKNIIVGDHMIDDMGRKTTVKSTTSGMAIMYKISPAEFGFFDTVVSHNHIMTLKIKNHRKLNGTNISWFDKIFYRFVSFNCATQREAIQIYNRLYNDTVDIPLQVYLALPSEVKSKLLLFKFDEDAIEMSSTSSFTVEQCGEGPYVGWQLSGNQRFLCADRVVYHNSPESHSIGIVLNLALTTSITNRYPTVIIRDILEKFKSIILIDSGVDCSNTKILLNGVILGITEDHDAFIEEFKIKRFSKLIPHTVSIGYDPVDNEILIYSDDGRLIRPIMNVNNGKIANEECKDLSPIEEWDRLFENNDIVFVDHNDINNAVIAFKESEIKEFNAQFCEISPSMMMGVMGSIIPYSANLQAPRVCYQSSMGKQAISMYALSNPVRTDTTVHVLSYGQKPLINTKPADMMGFNDMPFGINAIVAIACYTGFSQEDSVVVNRSSIDKGLFWATTYKTHTEEEKRHSMYSYERIELPPVDKRKSDANYSLLDENGIAKLNVYVEQGDAIIGKVSVQTNKDKQEEIFDCSLVLKKGDEGYVDKIIRTTTPDGYNMVKITIRKLRVPEMGDKQSCLIPTCEVLTTKGWKFIKDITLEDKVAILDNDNVKYENPSELHEYDYNGKMYELKSQQIELTTTPNHRMWVKRNDMDKFGFITAENCFGETVFYKNMVDILVDSDKSEKWIDYNDKVYCLTVRTGIFYVRQSGKPVWTGNSRSAQKSTIGLMLNYEDMPWTDSGMVPDMIINPHCIDGNTLIRCTHSNSMKIKDLVKQPSTCIDTVDPNTLNLTSTKFKDQFQVAGTNILKLTTISDRQIKCTPDHMFLVSTGEWKRADELQPNNDKVMICNMQLPLSQTESDNICVMARILGYLKFGGEIAFDRCLITFQSLEDVAEFNADLKFLGYSELTELDEMIYTLDPKLVPCLKTMVDKSDCVPTFVKMGSEHLKREYLSGVHGSSISNVYMLGNLVRIRGVVGSEAFVNDLYQLYTSLGINCVIRDRQNGFAILFSHKTEDVIKFSETIDFKYSKYKRVESACPIEYARSRMNLSYNMFKNCFKCNGGVAVYIDKIEKRTDRVVYDFTTISENHSFVANGFITHNCVPSSVNLLKGLGN